MDSVPHATFLTAVALAFLLTARGGSSRTGVPLPAAPPQQPVARSQAGVQFEDATG